MSEGNFQCVHAIRFSEPTRIGSLKTDSVNRPLQFWRIEPLCWEPTHQWLLLWLNVMELFVKIITSTSDRLLLLVENAKRVINYQKRAAITFLQVKSSQNVSRKASIERGNLSSFDGNSLVVKFVHCTLNKVKLTLVPRAMLSYFMCLHRGSWKNFLLW